MTIPTRMEAIVANILFNYEMSKYNFHVYCLACGKFIRHQRNEEKECYCSECYGIRKNETTK